MITVRFLYYNWFGIIPDDYTEGNKNMIQAIVLLVFLIFLNSVFAGAEMAVLSMNEAKMKELAEEGDHRAQILIKLTEQPAHFMTAIRVTVTTAGFLQSAFAAEYFAQPFRHLNKSALQMAAGDYETEFMREGPLEARQLADTLELAEQEQMYHRTF